MRKLAAFLTLVILMATATWALGQGSAITDTTANRSDTEVKRMNEILKIIGLPGVTEEAREAGLPEEDIQIIFEEAEKRELPAEDAEGILRESGAAAAESGPVDNFGAFVQSKLDEGLRGRELADAIHAEHRLHGKGKGHSKGKGKGHNKDHGKEHGIKDNDFDDDDRAEDGKNHRDAKDKNSDKKDGQGKNKKGKEK